MRHTLEIAQISRTAAILIGPPRLLHSLQSAFGKASDLRRRTKQNISWARLDDDLAIVEAAPHVIANLHAWIGSEEESNPALRAARRRSSVAQAAAALRRPPETSGKESRDTKTGDGRSAAATIAALGPRGLEFACLSSVAAQGEPLAAAVAQDTALRLGIHLDKAWARRVSTAIGRLKNWGWVASDKQLGNKFYWHVTPKGQAELQRRSEQ